MYPELFHISFLHTYGVLVALGFLAALWMAGRLGARAGLAKEQVTNLGLYCALAALDRLLIFPHALVAQAQVAVGNAKIRLHLDGLQITFFRLATLMSTVILQAKYILPHGGVGIDCLCLRR